MYSLAALLAMPLVASAATLSFDFGGDAAGEVGNVNNVYHNDQDVANAIDTDGNATGISLTVTSATGWNENGPNGNGPNPADAPMSDYFGVLTTQDNLFGHTDNFNVGAPRPLVEYTIAGLDGSGSTSYDFIFAAGRLGATDNRETLYTVAGAGNDSVALDSAGNTGAIASLAGLLPMADGSMKLTIEPGPNNNNGSHFFYLGGMQITTHGVPEPGSAVLMVLGAFVLPALRRNRK